MQFDPKIDLGQILTAATVVVLVTVYVVSSQGTATRATDQITALRSDVADLKRDTNAQLNDIRGAIVALPDVRASYTALDRRVQIVEDRLEALSKREENDQSEVIRTRSDLDNLIKSSQPIKR